jgi:uncharacterized protein
VGGRCPLASLGLTDTGPDVAAADLAAAAAPAAARRWPTGATVVIRQHRHGRFRAVNPMVVVEDRPDRRVFYVPRGTGFMAPADRAGRVTRSIRDEVGVVPDRWRDRAALHVVPEGAAFAVILRWEQSFDDFAGFYVNLQEPLRPTAIGFDAMDQTLDVLISPDRSQVRVKDEEELHEAAGDGFFSAAEVDAIREAAHLATRMVVDGVPPFDEPWHRWRPDPAWPTPELPAGWEAVPLSPSPWVAAATGASAREERDMVAPPVTDP